MPPARSPRASLDLSLPVPSMLVLPPASSAPVWARWSASVVLAWESLPLVLVVVVAAVGVAPVPLLLRPPPLGHPSTSVSPPATTTVTGGLPARRLPWATSS